MSLTIFSFQRAFSAKNQMALAAGNIDNVQAAMEAKDILDSLHLGLICEKMACDDFCDSTAAIDEFIANCQNILTSLAEVNENNITTLTLINEDKLTLKEENDYITLTVEDEQVTIPGLTLNDLYRNLINDIQNNADLYGTNLRDYIKHNEAVEPN